MKIHIEDDYYLTSDANNIIVSKISRYLTGEKKGQDNVKSISYHSNVEAALKSFFKMKLRLSDAQSLQDVINKIAEFDAKIDEMLEK
jgi:hypothetical protein